MEVILKRFDELHPYENNPRKNEPAVDAVAASIKEFGFRVPIIIKSDGEIIAGHTRLRAASALGLAEVPCVIADDLTEEQVKAFRLADNKTAELAGWDYDLLEKELEEIKGINMAGFGFEDAPPMDFSEMFEEREAKEKEPKKIQCPHCGEWIEL